jgi:hypothetical protein
MKDIKGNSFHVGCKIVRAVSDGYLQFCEVTRMEDSKLYLDNSKVAIRYPNRLLIVEQDPLYKLVKTYEASKE